jgi:hypothetical protein
MHRSIALLEERLKDRIRRLVNHERRKLAIDELFTLFTGGRHMAKFKLALVLPSRARSPAKPSHNSTPGVLGGKNRLAPLTKFMPANQGAHEMILKQTISPNQN